MGLDGAMRVGLRDVDGEMVDANVSERGNRSIVILYVLYPCYVLTPRKPSKYHSLYDNNVTRAMLMKYTTSHPEHAGSSSKTRPHSLHYNQQQLYPYATHPFAVPQTPTLSKS